MVGTDLAHETVAGGEQLTDALARTPIFARDAAGQPLEAVTAAAAKLLAGPEAARTRRILDAAGRAADSRPDSPFRGIVLPDSSAALEGWSRLRAVAEDPSIVLRPPEGGLEEVFGATWTRAVATFDHGYVVGLADSPIRTVVEHADGGREAFLRGRFASLGLTPAEADGAIRDADPAIVTTEAAAVLRHELEHADGVTDYRLATDAAANERSRVLEEGGDQTITYWPGQLERFLDDAGLRAEVPDATLARFKSGPLSAYGSEHAAVRDLVRRAGIDVEDPGQVDAAVTLLRGHRTSAELEDRIRAAISAHEGAPLDEAQLDAALRRATP
ncbi:MAG: hypothetical protein JWM98_583 [Thermoleophilia bacterium]|nr:hypothetical protein [Thermoleophilia bacterium]